MLLPPSLSDSSFDSCPNASNRVRVPDGREGKVVGFSVGDRESAVVTFAEGQSKEFGVEVLAVVGRY